MKNLVRLSIERPVFAWVLMSAMIIFGAISFGRLGIGQMPDVDFPVLSISLNYEGASPEVIETEILEPLESRLIAVEGILEMRSTARQGEGSVSLEFDIKRNVDVALQEVQSAVSQIRWPTGVEAPVIRKRNPEDQPLIFLGVSSSGDFAELVRWVEDVLIDEFRFLPGVGEVSTGGFSQRNLRIWPDPAKLKRQDLTITDLIEALRTQHFEVAAGQFTEDTKELRIRYLGEAASPEEISQIRLLRRGGQIIHEGRALRIADVARVEDGLSDIRRIARINGEPAVTVAIRKQRQANEVAVAEAIYKKLEDIRSRIPQGYSVQVNVDYSRTTRSVIGTTHEKLIGAAVITIAVCFLFLGSFQSALNILFSIPTSIVGTFLVIWLMDFSLNLFTLLALTLAVSIVVDDAIMLLENIVRHYRMGKSGAQAAYDGATEILPAASAATLAVVAVFLPVIFMDGVTGRFFFQFGIVLSAAVLLSLVEAVTITPMRAAAFLGKESKVSRFERWLDSQFEKLNSLYQRVLGVFLRFPISTVVGSIVLFAASLWFLQNVKKEFVPAQDQDLIIVSGQTPPGSNLQFTDSRVREVEAYLRQHPDVERFFVSIGAGGPASDVNQFFIPVTLKSRNERSRGHLEIMNEFREGLKKVSQLRIAYRDVSSRGITAGRQSPVSFTLKGPDFGVLNEKSNELIQILESSGLAQDLDTDFKMGLPELAVEPNRDAMALRGVSIEAVATALNAGMAGIRQSRFTADGKRFDIRVKFPDDVFKTRDGIRSIYVRNQYGNILPLSELVTISERKSIQTISRKNRMRAIGISGNLGANSSQAEVLGRAQSEANAILPTGYSFSLDGAAAGLQESFRGLTFALVTGLLVAYMILAVQFNSFIHPISVLMALPFALSGAFLFLWLYDISLNLFSFIGIIVLMGIAKKNSILLVEFTNHLREHDRNLSVRNALLRACPVRLRPILMTSVATILAAIPLMIGEGFGSEIRSPMGSTIVGGSIVSTLMTLFVVPCIYSLLSKLERNKESKLA